MVLTRAFMAGLLMHCCTAQVRAGVSGQCMQIAGTVVDYATHRPLQDTRLFAKLTTGRTLIATSSASGKFIGEVPCEATAIQIEKTGYRPQVLPLQAFAENIKIPQIALLIPLVAAEQPGLNRTYLQTEQKEYVQHNSVRTGEVNKSSVQYGKFIVTDALRNLPLQAQLCLIFTKNGDRRCIETEINGQFTVEFNQTDIVAVEVTATGYQQYEGNLIIDSLDGRSTTHNVQLIRDLTILSVWDDKATECKLLANNKTYTLLRVPGKTGWFSTYEVPPQPCRLLITRSQETIRKPVELRRGLNYVSLATYQSPVSPGSADRVNAVAVDASARFTPDSLPMIYFEQSSYKLRGDSQKVLKQVAQYMKRNQQFRLKVVGHTDNVGDERQNKSLSEFRAAVTITFLVRQGISESQFIKDGLGSQQPIAPNDTEINKALNRRVSLRLIAAQ